MQIERVHERQHLRDFLAVPARLYADEPMYTPPLQSAHRRVDEARSEPYRPVHLGDRAEPLPEGEIAPIDIEILPSATHFARGNLLRLDVQGRWFWRRSMFFGMFPCGYAASPPDKVTLHLGDTHDSYLLVPQA